MRVSGLLGTTRPGRRVAVSLVAAALALTACASDDGASSPPSSAPEGPQRGGTMVISASSDPGQFNMGITTSGGVRRVAGPIFNGLTYLSEDLEAQPDLATDWNTPDDGETWTFNLVENATWHDGEPFTSADVKYTWEEVLLKFHPKTRGLADIVESIETPDPYTVTFNLSEPYAPFPLRTGVIAAPILPKHLYEGTDPRENPANQDPIGTGPFKLVEKVQGSRVVLERNDDYFKEGLPYLDGVVYSIVPGDTQAALALEQGEIDYIPNVDKAPIERLESLEEVALERNISNGNGALNCINIMTFNTRVAGLDSAEARRGIAHAIDRERRIEQLDFGYGELAVGPISRNFSWAVDPNADVYDYDPERARELLDAAGFAPDEDGVRFSLDLIASGEGRSAELVKEDLAAVGIEVNVQLVDGPAANNAIFVSHEADLGFWGTCNAADPDIGVPPLYICDNIVDLVGANTSGYCNPEVDELFSKARSTTDQGERGEYYQQIQAIMLEDVPYLWLSEHQRSRRRLQRH